MKSTLNVLVALGLVTVGLVSLFTYLPNLLPQTALETITAISISIIAVLGIAASISQILDTIHRIIEQRQQAIIQKDEAELRASLPTEEQITLNIFNQYQNLVLRSCDAVDLAELPVLDAGVTMQEYSMDQIYIQMRLLIDKPLDSSGGETISDTANMQGFQKEVETGRNVERVQNLPTIQEEYSIGALINQYKQVVVLSDPGSGKSTLVKWLTSALILRSREEASPVEFPDIRDVPKNINIPVLVRCRDIMQHHHIQVLDDLLTHSLHIRALTQEEQTKVKELVTSKVKEGQVILIIDGLDEIRDTKTRTAFARRVQEISQHFSELSVLITSRIVGYEEMRSRLGIQFQQVTISDLTEIDRIHFCQKWGKATISEIDREQLTNSLIAAINSTEDIKRITGNPLLLTILAVVHRKLRKLPHRRAELYRYFMQVLFDLNPTVYERIDAREAYPQLSYLAYFMEQDGLSKLNEEELLKKFVEMREQYKSQSVRQHSPEQFLAQLSRQTSIIIQAGYVKVSGREIPVYEFKHDTFKHYFAGLALINNVYFNAKRKDNLGERIEHIFTNLLKINRDVRDWISVQDWNVSENWREVIRLCIASASLPDAEDGLEHMLTVGNKANDVNKRMHMNRTGVITASLCLADEPDISVDIGEKIIHKLSEHIIEGDVFDDKVNTSMDEALVALSNSQVWRQELDKKLLHCIETHSKYDSSKFGSAYILTHPEKFLEVDNIGNLSIELLKSLKSYDRVAVIEACLTLVNVLYRDAILSNHPVCYRKSRPEWMRL